MASERTAAEQAADELYALPPGDFTRARDERAKAFRKEGEREAADAVKALRKPTVAAWALNQLARARRKDVERLLRAGERLRAAQEDLLAGGDRSVFQEAAAEERELVAQLTGDATDLASEAGERGGGLEGKIADTLHAAALDEETAEQLRAGRLQREREAIGGFGGLAATPGPPSRSRPEGGARGRPAPERDKAQAGRAKRAPQKAKSSRSKAARDTDDGHRKAAEAAARQRLAGARTDERHARKELDAATKALAHAESRAEAAETHAAEAAERAKVTAERLKEARRAETRARRAHAKAERALDRAERG